MMHKNKMKLKRSKKGGEARGPGFPSELKESGGREVVWGECDLKRRWGGRGV